MKREDLKRNVSLVAGEARYPGRMARALARQPLEASASRRIAGLPRVEIADLVTTERHAIQLATPDERHDWSLGAVEQVVLQILVEDRGMHEVFEIGTFNGGTTRLLAEALPDGGRVVTLDLPPAQFTASQSPAAFQADQVGQAFRDSPARDRITQERCDSLTFDFGRYAHQFDLVLVDGAHDYRHGRADSASALQLVRPGGMILWDDFEPYWHGLVHGILDATEGTTIGKLAGTSLAVLSVPATEPSA